MTILFHRANKVGDNVVAIKAMYAIKCLYPSARLIVATNAIGANLYAHLPFIDRLINLSNDKDALSAIDCIDYLILSHRTSGNLALATSTNAKKIITQVHLRSLFSPRFLNDYNFFTKVRPESENLVRLVRLIDKRVFDSKIEAIDFSGAKLRFTQENSAFVEAFFASRGGVANSAKIIGINFFGSSGVGYFSLQAWCEMIEALAREFSNIDFIVLCPPNQHLESFNAPNVKIFVNNDDLLNLIAITARFNALISVDTGNVHIADNLQVPTLGIYTRKMLKRWRGGTYGGKFVSFVMPLHNGNYGKENDALYKQKFLGFLQTQIPTMIEY